MRKLAFTQAPAIQAPTIVTAAKIHTLDEAGSTPEAFLVIDDRIRAVGSVAECRAAAAEVSALTPELVDLGDTTVVPGFIDAHAHPLMLGQMMSWVDCGPEKAGSIPEIVALLQEAAKHAARRSPNSRLRLRAAQPRRTAPPQPASNSTRSPPTARSTS